MHITVPVQCAEPAGGETRQKKLPLSQTEKGLWLQTRLGSAAHPKSICHANTSAERQINSAERSRRAAAFCLRADVKDPVRAAPQRVQHAGAHF